jgi:tripartite-type tricarboxylate transporter receptor subunit TctC
MPRQSFNLLTGLLLSLCTLGATGTFAQDYPTKPVRLIVGNAPGAANEVPARWIATRLSSIWGRTVIADFRRGVAAIVAAESVAKALPDGYTLLFVDHSLVLPAIAGAPFAVDPVKDFAAVSLVASRPTLLVARASLRVTSLKEFMAYAAKNAGRMTFGSTGSGSWPHLYGELFNSMAGIEMRHIPYKGGRQAMNDLLAGRLNSMFVTQPDALPHLKTGRIVALGGAAMTRSQALPDLPSIHEQGITGFDVGARHGIVAPAKTPPQIIDRIHDGLVKVMTLPETRRAFAEAGLEPAISTPAQFAEWIGVQSVRWRQLIEATGIRPQ